MPGLILWTEIEVWRLMEMQTAFICVLFMVVFFFCYLYSKISFKGRLIHFTKKHKLFEKREKEKNKLENQKREKNVILELLIQKLLKYSRKHNQEF